jgi:hypothetical protein
MGASKEAYHTIVELEAWCLIDRETASFQHLISGMLKR